LLGTSTIDRTLSITPFSATVNCGSFTNSFTYTGVKVPSDSPFVYSNDYIEVEPLSGQIKIAAAKPVGTY
jgi:hypothetical protein